MDYKVSGHGSSTEVENREHELSLFARRVVQIPSNQSVRKEYDGSVLTYSGTSPRGLAEDADGWVLHKYTYDGLDRCIKVEVAYGNWDNRLLEDYA